MGEYPVSDVLEVLDGETIYKSDGWWKAILLCDNEENQKEPTIRLYLWQKRGKSWKNKHRYEIKSKENWEKEKSAVEGMVGALPNSN
jgi:hypothetical protein